MADPAPTKPNPVRLHAKKVRSAANTSLAIEPVLGTTTGASGHNPENKLLLGKGYLTGRKAMPRCVVERIMSVKK